MSTQTLFGLTLAAVVVSFLVVRGAWRAWATSRVREAAESARPSVDHLEAAIAAFHTRFPAPAGVRLPMDPEDYPEAKPRKPSAPRTRTRTSSRRRSGYRRRYR